MMTVGSRSTSESNKEKGQMLLLFQLSLTLLIIIYNVDKNGYKMKITLYYLQNKIIKRMLSSEKH
jgi:hypothetical protein